MQDQQFVKKPRGGVGKWALSKILDSGIFTPHVLITVTIYYRNLTWFFNPSSDNFDWVFPVDGFHQLSLPLSSSVSHEIQSLRSVQTILANKFLNRRGQRFLFHKFVFSAIQQNQSNNTFSNSKFCFSVVPIVTISGIEIAPIFKCFISPKN